MLSLQAVASGICACLEAARELNADARAGYRLDLSCTQAVCPAGTAPGRHAPGVQIQRLERGAAGWRCTAAASSRPCNDSARTRPRG